MINTIGEVRVCDDEDGELVEIDLERLDDGTEYCFRMNVEVDDLAEDIERNGLLQPVVVRKLRDDHQEFYQLICGYRRVTAVKRLGWTTIKALVRAVDDDEALRVSWAENEARQSYSELDRSHAVYTAHRAGKTFDELGELFGLSTKQLSRLETIATLPETVKTAITEGKITATHALVLNDGRRRHPDLKLARWIKVIEEEELSVRELRKRIRKEHRLQEKAWFEERDDRVKVRALTLKLDKPSEEDLEKLLELGQRLQKLYRMWKTSMSDGDSATAQTTP